MSLEAPFPPSTTRALCAKIQKRRARHAVRGEDLMSCVGMGGTMWAKPFRCAVTGYTQPILVHAAPSSDREQDVRAVHGTLYRRTLPRNNQAVGEPMQHGSVQATQNAPEHHEPQGQIHPGTYELEPQSAQGFPPSGPFGPMPSNVRPASVFPPSRFQIDRRNDASC